MSICQRIRRVDLKDTQYILMEYYLSLCSLLPDILSHYCKDGCGRKHKCSASLLGEPLLLYAFVHSLCFIHCIKVAKKCFHLCMWWDRADGSVCEQNHLFSRPPELHVWDAFKLRTLHTAAENRSRLCVVITTNTVIWNADSFTLKETSEEYRILFIGWEPVGVQMWH